MKMKCWVFLLAVSSWIADGTAAAGEVHKFEAETSKIMKLIVNSIYQNKDVFLREVISNAADALDKIRFKSLTDPSVLATNPDLEIRIRADAEKGILHITDTGIGMTKNDLVKNLGTIAHSGTAEFMAAMANKNDASDLIGQFGVGFYSTFLVADEVTVYTKNNDDTHQYAWTSDAENYSISVDNDETHRLGRGTTISLKLKDDAKEFLNENELEKLINKYNQFITFPIKLSKKKSVEKKVLKEKPPTENEDEEDKKDDDVTVEDDENDESKYETVKEEYEEYDLVNSMKPIWKRDPKDVEYEEYVEFYKTILKGPGEPLTWTHFKGEGEINFHALAFIPVEPRLDPEKNYGTREDSLIRLYVRNVYIMDMEVGFLPAYLNGMKVVIDSDDIPLNLSRETLQKMKLLKVIKRKLLKKILDAFVKLSEDDEDKYVSAVTKSYNEVFKGGVAMDYGNSKTLTNLIRYPTYKSVTTHAEETGEKAIPETAMVSLQNYVDNMITGQEKIYHYNCESYDQCVNAELVKKAVKYGYNVIFMLTAMDAYLVQSSLTTFKDIPFYNLANGVDAPKSTERDEWIANLENEYSNLISFVSRGLLSRVESVKLATDMNTHAMIVTPNRVPDGPALKRLMASNHVQDISYAKMLNTHGYGPRLGFELNPLSPVIKKLNMLITNVLTEMGEENGKTYFYKEPKKKASKKEKDGDNEEEEEEDVPKNGYFSENLCKDPASKWYSIRNTLLAIYEFARLRSGYDPSKLSEWLESSEYLFKFALDIKMNEEFDQLPVFAIDVEEEVEEEKEIEEVMDRDDTDTDNGHQEL